MNARRKLTVALGAGVAVSMMPLTAWPQQTGSHRIAVLVSGSRAFNGRSVDAFRRRLQSDGYVEGRNVTYDLRFGEGRNESFPEVVQDILNHKPAIIVVSGSGPAHAAKAATSTVPIVMAGVGDPVGTGLAPNLSRPGGNITGIGLLVEQTIAKEIELLREVVPHQPIRSIARCDRRSSRLRRHSTSSRSLSTLRQCLRSKPDCQQHQRARSKRS